jgi:hypothetical protein
MLLVLTGSSCAGKSTLAFAQAGRIDRLAIHDSDESGVPSDPPPHWRNHNTEEWIRRALEYQADGVDLLLTGQAPLGEILAAPSAPRLDAISVCLVDVSDDVRGRRLAERDPGRWSAEEVDRFNRWAAWHRGHARDPRHHPEVITAESAPMMAWDRWSDWTADDPRWRVHIIDTTSGSRTDELSRWITEQRAPKRSSINAETGPVRAHRA